MKSTVCRSRPACQWSKSFVNELECWSDSSCRCRRRVTLEDANRSGRELTEEIGVFLVTGAGHTESRQFADSGNDMSIARRNCEVVDLIPWGNMRLDALLCYRRRLESERMSLGTLDIRAEQCQDERQRGVDWFGHLFSPFCGRKR